MLHVLGQALLTGCVGVWAVGRGYDALVEGKTFGRIAAVVVTAAALVFVIWGT